MGGSFTLLGTILVARLLAYLAVQFLLTGGSFSANI